MTILVLDPTVLKQRFSQASAARSVRLRLILQTVRFDYKTSTLTATKIAHTGPNFAMDFDLSNLPLSEGVARKGCIVSIYGYYDGQSVEVTHCMAEDDRLFLQAETFDTINKVSNLDPL